MKNKTIYKLASLVMALVMILGNTIDTQAARPAAQAAGPSIYWGALLDAAPTSPNLQNVIIPFEARSKKKMSIYHWGQPWKMRDGSWGEFQTSYFENVRKHGSIPMLNWSSHQLGGGINQPDFQLRDVYAGTYDTYIRRWATAAKNWGHPFFLYFNPEMNGWWYPWGEGKTAGGAIVNGNSPGDFVLAWRHVHDIFTSVGATNITWVWGPNIIANSDQNPDLSTLYPGGAYVDWTALSVYNTYSTWLGLNPLLTGKGLTWLKNSYQEVLTVAPARPMMLAQWASDEAGDGGAKKAAWITDALTVQIPNNFPKIKAVVYFNWDNNTSETWPIETSQAATNAWAAGIALPVYATNQYANLNVSPIPPLANSPTGGTATLMAGTDSYIDSAKPASTAGGTSTVLRVDGSPVQKTFLKFNLSQLAGKTIISVKLKVKTTANPAAGSANRANVKLVKDTKWKEQYLSYSNRVPISATLLGRLPANTAPNTWYTIRLAPSAIQQRLGGLLSLAIAPVGSDELLLYSGETTNKPRLVIIYK